MRVVSFDTETRGLDWFNEDEGPFLVTWSDARGDHLSHCDDPAGMARFAHDLAAADIVVAHNLPFDVHHLRKHCGIDVLAGLSYQRILDTAILARVTLPERRSGEGDARGFGLDELSRTYLPSGQVKISLDEAAKAHGISLKKKGGYHELWRRDPELLEDYAKRDTRATYELLPHLAGTITDRLRPTWELERDVQPWLIRAEARGVAVDQDRVVPLAVDYADKQLRAYDNVVAALGDHVLAAPDDDESKDNHDALREALLAHGVPLYRTTAKSEDTLATNRFALQEFAAEYPVIEDLLTYRTASKFLATYINPMLGREAVHPSFWQIGAWTGRMSCSRPNMQNIPVRGEGAGELRAMFVPRPGHVFVVSDFDAIEVRLLAHYLNNPNYKAMISAGLDPHAWMASNIWGGTAAGYAKGGPNDKLRAMAKNVLFAIVYGAGAPRVMDMLGEAGMPASRDEAKELIRSIKSALPGYWKLNSRVRKKVEQFGHVNTIWGRRQPVNQDKAYIGLNALIQGSAADIMKQGIINTAEAVAPLGALPVLFVHDEIVTECPAEHANEVARLQTQAMADAYSLDPELLASTTIAERSYADAK